MTHDFSHTRAQTWICNHLPGKVFCVKLSWAHQRTHFSDMSKPSAWRINSQIIFCHHLTRKSHSFKSKKKTKNQQTNPKTIFDETSTSNFFPENWWKEGPDRENVDKILTQTKKKPLDIESKKKTTNYLCNNLRIIFVVLIQSGENKKFK